MIDVEPIIRSELDRIYPDPELEPDWDAVLVAGGLRRRRLEWRRRLAVAGVAAVAVAVAVALLPAALTDRGRVNIAERALAAVSTGPVLHAVLEVPVSALMVGPGPEPGPEPRHVTVVSLADGRERPAMFTTELWYDSERQLLHQKQLSDGAVLWDHLHTAERTHSNRRPTQPADGPPQIDPGLAAFFKGYRRALEDGSARVVGDDVVGGRAVTWLRFPPVTAGGPSHEVAVDADSYEPVATRAVCPECAERTYRVVRLEGIDRDAANFTPPREPARTRIAAYAGRPQVIALDEAASALARRAVWAGPEVDGLALTAVRLVKPSSHSGVPPTEENLISRGRGLQFFYGGRLENGSIRATPGGRHVGVSVSADWQLLFGSFNFNNAHAGQPLTLAHGAVPPEGQAALTSHEPGYWTAQLQRDGLYVEIDGSSRELVLEAARSLRVLQPQ